MLIKAVAEYTDFKKEEIAEAYDIGELKEKTLMDFHNAIARYVENSITKNKAFCVSVYYETEKARGAKKKEWQIYNFFLNGREIEAGYFNILRDIEKIKNPKAYEDYKKRLLQKAKR